MLIAGLVLNAVLATQVLAQCDRAADCAASDPWFYQCTDGTRADYTGCANACCAAMNAAICSDPVQSYDYDGCMDACSAAAEARCGKPTTPVLLTTTPATSSTTSPTSSPTSSPTACLAERAITNSAGQCINSAQKACQKCHNGVLESNGKTVTYDGCGQLQDEAIRQIQERKYPLMTEVCNQHDKCFGECGNGSAQFRRCNDALLAGALEVCKIMADVRKKFCLDQKESPANCDIERTGFFSGCVLELVYYTNEAIHLPRMCQAFNDAQNEFCKCSNQS